MIQIRNETKHALLDVIARLDDCWDSHCVPDGEDHKACNKVRDLLSQDGVDTSTSYARVD